MRLAHESEVITTWRGVAGPSGSAGERISTTSSPHEQMVEGCGPVEPGTPASS